MRKKMKKNDVRRMDGGVGHTAWAPEGREGRSQAGLKGRQLERLL